jgi:hypothetical protein
VHKRIMSAVRRVGFVGDRRSYITLRGRWCNTIVLNVHAPTEDKTGDVKDSFYEELEREFDKFCKHDAKIVLGDFSAKVLVGREGIFKPLPRYRFAQHVPGSHTLLSEIHKQSPWPESASELYRPSDRSLSAKLVPTLTDRGVSRGQRAGSLRP